MSLKFTYQRFTTIFLLAVMLWNITGWIGMGIISEHLVEHSESEHCEVSFCYCKIVDGEKICTCHHPELHAAKMNKNGDNESEKVHSMKASHDHQQDHSSDTTDESSYCYYSQSHDFPVQDDNVIVMSDFRSLLLYSKELNRDYEFSDYLSNYSFLLNKGFKSGLFRPPAA
mgnify:CR=1 FL=1